MDSNNPKILAPIPSQCTPYSQDCLSPEVFRTFPTGRNSRNATPSITSCPTCLDEPPEDVRAVVAVGRRGVGELLKAVRLREHLGRLAQHLAFDKNFYGRSLVNRSAMGSVRWSWGVNEKEGDSFFFFLQQYIYISFFVRVQLRY